MIQLRRRTHFFACLALLGGCLEPSAAPAVPDASPGGAVPTVTIRVHNPTSRTIYVDTTYDSGVALSVLSREPSPVAIAADLSCGAVCGQCPTEPFGGDCHNIEISTARRLDPGQHFDVLLGGLVWTEMTRGCGAAPCWYETKTARSLIASVRYGDGFMGDLTPIDTGGNLQGYVTTPIGTTQTTFDFPSSALVEIPLH
jgi:hypothetical protein